MSTTSVRRFTIQASSSFSLSGGCIGKNYETPQDSFAIVVRAILRSQMLKDQMALLAMLALGVAVISPLGARDVHPKPSFVYGSLSGQPTFDRDAEGGNPFATAFIRALAVDRATSFGGFTADVIRHTGDATRGQQQPEVVGAGHLDKWLFLPRPKTESSVALIVVFSNYAHSGVGASLPGAERDLLRVGEALSKVGFAVTRLANPDDKTLTQVLKAFARTTITADVALIYATGHGAERQGVSRLLVPYVRRDGSAEVLVSELASALRARRANLVFYAACRSNR